MAEIVNWSIKLSEKKKNGSLMTWYAVHTIIRMQKA